MTTEHDSDQDFMPKRFVLRRAKPNDIAGDKHAHVLEIHKPAAKGTDLIGMHQGELIDLWQQIGAYFSLAGMGEAGGQAGCEPSPCMTGPEHYKAAEGLLAQARDIEDWQAPVAAAQAHATLALAAATGLAGYDLEDDGDDWMNAASVTRQA